MTANPQQTIQQLGRKHDMVTLKVSDQELFDIIMTLHAANDSAHTGADPKDVRERQLLLDKLHDAFEPLFAR